MNPWYSLDGKERRKNLGSAPENQSTENAKEKYIIEKRRFFVKFCIDELVSRKPWFSLDGSERRKKRRINELAENGWDVGGSKISYFV